MFIFEVSANVLLGKSSLSGKKMLNHRNWFILTVDRVAIIASYNIYSRLPEGKRILPDCISETGPETCSALWLA